MPEEQEEQPGEQRPLIHDRAREQFGWTEFGYITAAMFDYGAPSAPAYWLAGSAEAVSIDLADLYRLVGPRRECFRRGWQHYFQEKGK